MHGYTALADTAAAARLRAFAVYSAFKSNFLYVYSCVQPHTATHARLLAFQPSA